mmetsp:Transcript_55515/g.136042  ORF Transcript_55515/g.136042 Transcript_55515/m.136042 type:complete len:212 (-) Transcript_55515:850-1485(-)
MPSKNAGASLGTLLALLRALPGHVPTVGTPPKTERGLTLHPPCPSEALPWQHPQRTPAVATRTQTCKHSPSAPRSTCGVHGRHSAPGSPPRTPWRSPGRPRTVRGLLDHGSTRRSSGTSQAPEGTCPPPPGWAARSSQPARDTWSPTQSRCPPRPHTPPGSGCSAHRPPRARWPSRWHCSQSSGAAARRTWPGRTPPRVGCVRARGSSQGS